MQGFGNKLPLTRQKEASSEMAHAANTLMLDFQAPK